MRSTPVHVQAAIFGSFDRVCLIKEVRLQMDRSIEDNELKPISLINTVKCEEHLKMCKFVIQ